jgi:hypothetical protein
VGNDDLGKREDHDQDHHLGGFGTSRLARAGSRGKDSKHGTVDLLDALIPIDSGRSPSLVWHTFLFSFPAMMWCDYNED